jgi:hypothetical protein
MVLSVVARCMSGEEEKMSLEIWCDLLEAELKRALEDLSVIRGLDKAQAKSKSHMLKEALDKAVAEIFGPRQGLKLDRHDDLNIHIPARLRCDFLRFNSCSGVAKDFDGLV